MDVCLVMAVRLRHQPWAVAPVFGVVGGGLLIAMSYRTIGCGVSGLVERLARPAGTRGPPPAGVGKTALLVASPVRFTRSSGVHL